MKRWFLVIIMSVALFGGAITPLSLTRPVLPPDLISTES